MTSADLSESLSLGDHELFKALTALPGVQSTANRGAEFWVRGAPFEQTSIRWDGLPLYNAIAGRGQVAAVNSDAIGGAFLYAGSRPARVAGGGAAVLDLTTRPAGGTGDVRGVGEMSGSWARLAVEQRAAGGRLGWLVAGRRQLVSRHDATDLSVRLDVMLDGERRIDVSGLSVWDEVTPQFNGFNNGASSLNRALRVAYRAPIGAFSSTHFVGGSHNESSVTLDADAPSLRGLPAPQPPTDLGIRYVTFGSHFRRTSRSAAGSAWRFGYEIIAQRIRYGGPVPNMSSVAEPVAEVTFLNELRYGTVWAEHRTSPLRAWEVEFGVRTDIGAPLANRAAVRPAPRVAVRFRPARGFTLSAAAGRSHRYAQGIGETGTVVGTVSGGRRRLTRVWALAGDSVPAARTDVVSLGAESWVGASWLAAVSAYSRRSSGLAFPDPRPGLVDAHRPFVIGTDRAWGLELSARRLVGRWTAAFGYSYSKARRRADGFDFPTPADIRHSVDGLLSWRVARPLRVGAAFVATTGAPVTRQFVCDQNAPSCPEGWERIDEPNTLRSPSLVRINLFAEWTKRFSAWDVGLFGRWNNVFGRDNDIAYVGTIPGCSTRFLTCPDATAVDMTDRFLPVFGVRKVAVGVKVAF